MFKNAKLNDQIERITGNMALIVHQREENWMSAMVAEHFPGIYALVQSRQLRAAAVHMRAIGIHRAVYPDGTQELRQGDRVIGELKPLEFFTRNEHSYIDSCGFPRRF